MDDARTTNQILIDLASAAAKAHPIDTDDCPIPNCETCRWIEDSKSE